MKKNIFDKLSDSYEQFHLKDTEIQKGGSTIVISPKLKLTLGWSLFVLCCVLAYIVLGNPFQKNVDISAEEKEKVLTSEVDVEEEHDTIIPYEKDADEEVIEFVTTYLKAITNCDNLALQDMVTDSSQYNDNEDLKKKAEFITAYDNITVYTKEGLDEGSYVAFVVANVTITGVNSNPYDILTLYLINGARGYLVNNGQLSEDAAAYIEKIKGDEDIQKIYRSVEKKNNELKEKDASLREFYEIISRRNVETNSMADQLTTEAPAEDGGAGDQSQEQQPEGEQPQEQQPEGEQPAPEEGQSVEGQEEQPAQ